MILVTGATGQFGSKTIDHLLKKGVKPSEISALVRNVANADHLKSRGIKVKVGDYTDYDSLVKAFQGVEKLLLISSNDREAVENRTAQHINIIKAAKEANIKYVVYTSFVRKTNFENSSIAAFQNSHAQTEAYLIDSDIEYTILQNGIYLEMIPIFAGEKVAETGAILFPAGDGKASYVLREELAEAAAHVLTTEGHGKQIYSLTNSTSVSFGDVATAIGNQLRKDVKYQSLEVGVFESKMKQFGVPDLYIGMFTMWATAQAEGTMDVVNDTLEEFLGRKPTTMPQFIAQVY
ncbi:NAD(P)-dependent oxidoreductase [Pedobacter sp. HMWF019]|uniref:SDR family oxidoreductase n=1 Tax=Pedobacter sp. HMWF019 TaxID=2056856 RepID=UPI000D36ED81|nr:SDR family oxidoreductase [Pedobacter sp. HMWF019]PTT02188.1 NAD(P)-dependent oxidoreductase [Pedobacter sp. HMWF019]